MSNKKYRARRAAQGYEKAPPRCINCAEYVPPIHASPATSYRPALPYAAPRCSVGDFPVEPHAICDLWHSSDGSTLEGTP